MSPHLMVNFNLTENFAAMPQTESLTLALVSNGKIILAINGAKAVLIAPCVFLTSPRDRIVVLESHQPTAKSIHFHPALVNKNFSIENLGSLVFANIADDHDHQLLNPFLMRTEGYNGVIKPLPQAYLRISEWFDAADRESKIKNDGRWLHRVRRYLLQILLLIEETCQSESGASDESVMDIVMEHIHTHYAKKITLDTLCKLVYVNRTSLTRLFKEHTRRSPIDYLLHHRLDMACKLLTHSSLSIGKIAETTGFKYESYFTRQFTGKIGMTPTQYRQSDGFETLNTEESRIVDEF